jgi:hypothetical protein
MPLVRRLLPIFALGLGACTADKGTVEKQLSKLKDEVAQLQSENDRMGERLDAMEARQTNATRENTERPVAGAVGANVTRPKLKVVRVEPGTELAAADEASADATGDDSGPRVVIQGEGKSLETRTLPGAPVAAKSAPPAAKTKADKKDTRAAKPEAESGN